MIRRFLALAMLAAATLLSPASRAQSGAPACLGAGRDASTDPARHLEWAAVQTDLDLSSDANRKIGLLAQCAALGEARWLDLFAALAVLIARAQPDAVCFGGDAEVVAAGPGPHRAWARETGRSAAAANLQWRVTAALNCLDAAPRQRLYAELSAALAQAGGGAPGARSAAHGDTGAARTPQPAPAPPVTPLAGVWRVRWRDQNTTNDERWEITPAQPGRWIVRHTLLDSSVRPIRAFIGKSANDIALIETGPGKFRLEQTGGDPNSSDLSHFEQTGEGRCDGDRFTLEGRHRSVARFFSFTAEGVRESPAAGAPPAPSASPAPR